MRRICFTTRYLYYEISENGQNIGFINKETGENRIIPGPCVTITNFDRTEVCAEKASFSDGVLCVLLEDGTTVEILAEEQVDYITFTIQYVSRDDFLSIAFVNIRLAEEESDFCGTLMGMTLSTRMQEHPGDNRILKASAYSRIGVFSTARSPYPAKAAVIGAPKNAVREIERKVLDEIPDGELPKSRKGGPYADLAAKEAEGTYSMFSKTVNMENIDSAIADLKRFHIHQVNLHHFGHYVQGEFSCDAFYPGGVEEFKRVVDHFHKEGILVGMHSYAFFLSTKSSYVTPVPHPDLDTLHEFTLKKTLKKEDSELWVWESTEGITPETGYLMVNSPYLWVDDELMKFSAVGEGRFEICERGSYGTIPAAHAVGARVRQLKEYFFLPMARAGSELFYEIARNTARFYNESGMDLFYLDALDGAFVLEGDEYVWYHAMDFIREMFRYLERDPVFDCCHNLNYTGSWFVRSRYGAVDESLNSHRQYFDAHVRDNEKTALRMGVTPELGWVDLYPHDGVLETWWQNEPVYAEDLEYLCAKAFAAGASLAFMQSFRKHMKLPCTKEYIEILDKYVAFREMAAASEETREYLKEANHGAYLKNCELYRVKHSLGYLEHSGDGFIIDNPFETQKPMLLIEALCAAEDYDHLEGRILCDISEKEPLKNRSFRFAEPVSSEGKRGLGVWCYGDGSGAIVCISLRNFSANQQRAGEHYIRVNFEGWKYFAFYENQNGCLAADEWPSMDVEYSTYNELQKFYGYYRARINYDMIDGVDITVKGSEKIRLKAIRLLPHRKPVWKNPKLRFGENSVTFLTELHADSVLFFDGEECVIKDKLGNILEKPKWTGAALVPEGKISVSLESSGRDSLVRAKIHVGLRGSRLQ